MLKPKKYLRTPKNVNDFVKLYRGVKSRNPNLEVLNSSPMN